MNQPTGCSNLNPFDAKNVSFFMGMDAKFSREHLVFFFGAHIRPGLFDKDLFSHESHFGASLFEDDEVLSVRFGANLTGLLPASPTLGRGQGKLSKNVSVPYRVAKHRRQAEPRPVAGDLPLHVPCSCTCLPGIHNVLHIRKHPWLTSILKQNRLPCSPLFFPT